MIFAIKMTMIWWQYTSFLAKPTCFARPPWNPSSTKLCFCSTEPSWQSPISEAFFGLYSDFSGCKAGSEWDVTGRLPNKATRGEETWSSWHQRRLPRKLRLHLYCPLRTSWKPGDFGLKNEDSNCKLLLHLHGCNIWRIQRQFHVAKSPQAIRSPGHVLPLQWSCRCVSKPLRPTDPHMDHSFVGFCWIFQSCPIFSGQMEAQSCSCSDFPPSKLGVNDLPYPHDVWKSNPRLPKLNPWVFAARRCLSCAGGSPSHDQCMWPAFSSSRRFEWERHHSPPPHLKISGGWWLKPKRDHKPNLPPAKLKHWGHIWFSRNRDTQHQKVAAIKNSIGDITSFCSSGKRLVPRPVAFPAWYIKQRCLNHEN